MMTMPSVKLLSSLASAGESLKLELFEDRLALQKVTYLLQEAGVVLGYDFTWYVRGPYSPSLTKDAYQLAGLNVDAKNLPDLDAEDKPKVASVSDLVRGVQAKKEGREYWLELLASLHFVAKYLCEGQSEQQVLVHFKLKKPKFSDDNVREAWTLLSSHNLIRR
jgi:uncharacterized protein YwgA